MSSNNETQKRLNSATTSNTSPEEPPTKRQNTEAIMEESSSSPSVVTPLSILSTEHVKIQTLTVSDQHATLLLTQDPSKDNQKSDDEDDDKNTDKEEDPVVKKPIQSLLKITPVPFHKSLLGSNPVTSKDEEKTKPDLKLLNHDPEASKKIISFLKDYEFKLKSESGAEYSYYHAKPSTNLLSEITSMSTSKSSKLKEEVSSSSSTTTTTTTTAKEVVENIISKTCKAFGTFDIELISPASQRQLSRAMPSLGSTMVHETAEIYEDVVHPYIKSIVEGNSLGWIQNIIEVKKEKERLLVNDPEFIINIDTKWRSHPDPFKVPKEEWHGHKCAEDLYCLGIVKAKGIATLRDLRGDHIPMLKSMQSQGYNAIERIYGVKADQIKCFVHYQPQFYHFHVHFTRLENEIGTTVERAHLLTDVIQNLEMDGSYYEKRTITYKLKKFTPLHNLIQTSLLESSENKEKETCAEN